MITVTTMVPMMFTMVVLMIFCQLVYIGCDIRYSILGLDGDRDDNVVNDGVYMVMFDTDAGDTGDDNHINGDDNHGNNGYKGNDDGIKGCQGRPLGESTEDGDLQQCTMCYLSGSIYFHLWCY